MKLLFLSCYNIISQNCELMFKPEMVIIHLCMFENRGAAEQTRRISINLPNLKKSSLASIINASATMFATARKAAKDLISSLPVNAEDDLNLPSQCKTAHIPWIHFLTCLALPEEYSLLQLYERLAIDDENRSKEVSSSL